MWQWRLHHPEGVAKGIFNAPCENQTHDLRISQPMAVSYTRQFQKSPERYGPQGIFAYFQNSYLTGFSADLPEMDVWYRIYAEPRSTLFWYRNGIQVLRCKLPK